MAQPDASLGISAGFPEDLFRNGITFAMQMGAPNLAGRAAVFVKESTAVRYFVGADEVFPPPDGTLRLDREGKPLNANVRMVREQDTEIEGIDCAIEIQEADAEELPVGNFRPVKAVVTILDEEYAKIEGARELQFNGDEYAYGYEPETNGLFGVDVHTMIFYAKDES